jgi:hypothetical protein
MISTIQAPLICAVNVVLVAGFVCSLAAGGMRRLRLRDMVPLVAVSGVWAGWGLASAQPAWWTASGFLVLGGWLHVSAVVWRRSRREARRG